MTAVELLSTSGARTGAGPGRRGRTRVGPGVFVAAAFFLLVCVTAIWPSAFASDPDAADPLNALHGPSGNHLFGTDELGRDVFARVVHGAGASVGLGLGATALACVVGLAWGLAAGLGGRFADEALMRLADIVMSIPSTLMALLVVAVLGTSERNVTIAIAVALAPGFARVVRVQTKVVAQAGYVQAATVLGVRRRTTVARHVVPNVLPPIFVLATSSVGTAMIAGASLSFLGLGSQSSAPEWGAMLSQARDYLARSWSVAVFPGLAITLTVISIGVVGRELQSRFEGRTTR